jgi:carboxyl-terminal processing protease
VVLERHLEAAPPADLALWSLRGVAVLDPRFAARRQGNELQLLLDDRIIARAPPPAAPRTPQENGGSAVAATLTRFYEAAWAASPAVQRAGAERLIANGFDELFNHLDPYSRYVTAAETREARERRVGQSGLGLRVAARGPHLVMVSITRGGPAAAAGLRPGDRLVAVDDQAVDGSDPGRAATLLEGPEESEVTLTLLRAGRSREVTLRRELVVPETVQAEWREGILWVRVSGFSTVTDRRLAQVLVDGFAGRSPRGVVLDLRGNRGGLLGNAIAVADAFLAEGEVARTEGRHPDANRSYEAGGQDLARGRPVVVLVDGRTASAAEIVAAGLMERGRAVVVGSATTGKGLIQLVAPLPNEAELLVSWSRVVSPAGWPIQGLGVLPALCTSLGPEALARALSQLNRGEAPMGAALTRQRAARAPVLASEVTALRGACPPAEGRSADLTAARALIDSPSGYRTALGSLTATPP